LAKRIPHEKADGIHFGFTQLFLLLLMLLVVNSTLDAQPAGKITWPKEVVLTAADRQDIITLAKRMGIEDPQRVSLTGTVPATCRWLRIESAVTQSGQLRTWFELRLVRQDWGCVQVPRGSNPVKVGRWMALDSASVRLRGWRIQEDGWHVDVSVRDSPVSYEEAKLIVLAIRHGTLSDQRLYTNKSCKISDIDASTIVQIQNSSRDPTSYLVVTIRGTTTIFLTVKTVNGQVELYECGPPQ
jgi:hypothetical protein